MALSSKDLIFLPKASQDEETKKPLLTLKAIIYRINHYLYFAL